MKKTRMEKYRALRSEIELENLLDQRVFLTSSSNKYQEAIDHFKAYKNICTHSKFDDDIYALQELIYNFEDCRNELCLSCGNFKEEHLGKCDRCRWGK